MSTETEHKIESPVGPFVIKPIVDAAQVTKDLSVNPSDMQNGFLGQGGLFFHYARLKSDAVKQYERAKAAFELLESKLNHEHRTNLLEEQKQGGPKPTEAMVTTRVTNDKRWWAANQAMIDARAIAELAKDTLEAFRQRKDMLIQAGADQRQEREAEVRLMGNPGGAGMSPAVRAAAASAAENASEIVEQARRDA